METRTLRAGCLVAGLLLLALSLYPPSFLGLFAKTTNYYTEVAPEGSEAYRQDLETVDETGGSPADLRVVEYGSLSPEAQRFVDRALEGPVDEDGAYDYGPRVCVPYAVACPGVSHDAAPPELAYEYHAPLSEVAVFVERGDRRYLVTTRGLFRGAVDPAPIGPSVFAAIRIALLVPLGGVLVVLGAGSLPWPGRRGWTGGERSRGVSSAVLGRGLLVAYALLVAGLAFSSGLLLSALVWLAPWLLPGLLAPETSRDAVLWSGIGLGILLAAIALVPPYLSAYGVLENDGVYAVLAGVVVGWVGAVALHSAARIYSGEADEADRATEAAP